MRVVFSSSFFFRERERESIKTPFTVFSWLECLFTGGNAKKKEKIEKKLLRAIDINKNYMQLKIAHGGVILN